MDIYGIWLCILQYNLHIDASVHLERPEKWDFVPTQVDVDEVEGWWEKVRGSGKGFV